MKNSLSIDQINYINSLKEMYGVYKLTHVKTNNSYIGASKCLRTRIKSHFHKLENNSHPKTIMQASYNSSKDFVVTILEKNDTENYKHLRELERYYIDKEKPFFNGKNNKKGRPPGAGNILKKEPKKALPKVPISKWQKCLNAINKIIGFNEKIS